MDSRFAPQKAEADRPDRRAGPIGGPPREMAQLGQGRAVLLKTRRDPEGAVLAKTCRSVQDGRGKREETSVLHCYRNNR